MGMFKKSGTYGMDNLNNNNDESSAKIFVMMPYDQKFDDIYNNIKRVVEEDVSKLRLLCRRLDDIKSAGRITEDLTSHIQTSPLLIADITGNNPNVMWEVGYAMALMKPVILIAQSIDSIPFDLKDYRVTKYGCDKLDDLRQHLSESISETISKYQIKVESRIIRTPEKGSFAVAVTGSNIADAASCRRSIESVIKPYLNTDTTFYVGGGGTSDETSAEYLGSMKQKIVVVGHHALDMSQKMLEIANKYNFTFIDASKEGLPKGLISERNLFLVVKAKLMIFLWNGRPGYTQSIIGWCRAHGKDHIVASTSLPAFRSTIK